MWKLIWLASSLMISHAKNLPEFVGSETQVIEFVRRSEKWRKEDVRQTPLPLSKFNHGEFESVQSTTACGTGVCPQYLFSKQKSGKWKLIAFVPGVLRILTTDDQGMFRIQSVSKIGAEDDESIIETFKFNGNVYVEVR